MACFSTRFCLFRSVGWHVWQWGVIVFVFVVRSRRLADEGHDSNADGSSDDEER